MRSNDRAIKLFAAVAARQGAKWTYSDSPKFGSNALRVHGKIYAALTRSHRLLLKLPPALIAELLATRRAERFESGGRVMNGWVTLGPEDPGNWIELSEKARVFVEGEAKRKKK